MKRDEIAFGEGQAAARIDVAEGRLVYRWSGHAGHSGHWFVTRLEERFGVGVHRFGMCLVDAQSESFNAGYNSVLSAEVDQRYGVGAIQALFDESRRQSLETLCDARRNWLTRHNMQDEI